MNLINTIAAWQQINAMLKRPITRQLFTRTVVPLMVERGDAHPLGTTYAIDAGALPVWIEYLAERERRIAEGDWNTNHPYNLDDMEELTQENQP